MPHSCCFIELSLLLSFTSIGKEDGDGGGGNGIGDPVSLRAMSLVGPPVIDIICDRLWENRAQRGMRRHRKKIDLVLKIVLNKPNKVNG